MVRAGRGVLDFSEAEEGFEHVRALLLAVVKRRWEDRLNTKEMALRFDLFALRVAPDLAWKRLENRIRGGPSDRTNLPERVSVPERLPDGKPLGTTGNRSCR